MIDFKKILEELESTDNFGDRLDRSGWNLVLSPPSSMNSNSYFENIYRTGDNTSPFEWKYPDNQDGNNTNNT